MSSTSNQDDNSQPCIFASYGCQVRFFRSIQLKEHLENSLREHLELMLSNIEQLNVELRLKEFAINNIQNRYNHLYNDHNTLINQTKHLDNLSNLLSAKDNLIESQFNEIKRLRELLLNNFCDKNTIKNDEELSKLLDMGVIPKTDLYSKLFLPLSENDMLPAANVESLKTHHAIIQTLVQTSISSMKVITTKWEEDFKKEQERKSKKNYFLSSEVLSKLPGFSALFNLHGSSSYPCRANISPFMSVYLMLKFIFHFSHLYLPLIF